MAYQCKPCQLTFRNGRRLMLHRIRIHDVAYHMGRSLRGRRPFCRPCTLPFKSTEEIDAHQQAKHGVRIMRFA